ncbi:MAG: CDP-alcohol phosphatidyltransferase family protein, partial [Nocardioidaceae bacterium]
TLARAVLASGCAAVTVLVLAGTVPGRTWWLLSLAVPCLLLDAADGLVARRTGTVSAAGARLDGELDAGILVVLSLAVAPVLGAWVLLIGAMRYLFLAGSWVRPPWRGPLARSDARRAVAGLQGAALAVAAAPVVPLGVATAGVAVALLLLAVSFARDVVTLETRAKVQVRVG